MKQEVKQTLLATVKAAVKANAGRGDFPHCPIIFHQPKRPKKNKL